MVQTAFLAGATGRWKVERLEGIRGPSLATASHLEVSLGSKTTPQHALWILHGVTSHERYATRAEHDRIAAVQPPLDRAEATSAARFPIARAAARWEFPQQDRRATSDEVWRYVAFARACPPASARRTHHVRDFA